MKFLFLSAFLSLPFWGLIANRSESAPAGITNMKLQLLRQIEKVDAERRKNEEKIFKIIERFNPEMTESMRKEVAGEILEMSVKYPNLDVDLICATITHESARSWDPAIKSNAGAIGLMQIMPATGKWLARIEGIKWTSADNVLYDPVSNIRMGSRYLSALIEMYELDGGLAAYNGGGRRVELWLAHDKADGILWTETQNYVPQVLKLYDEFKGLSL